MAPSAKSTTVAPLEHCRCLLVLVPCRGMFTRTPPTNKKLNTDQIQAILENESEDESRKEKMNEEDQKLAPVGEAEAKKQNKDASAKVEEKFEQMMNTLTQSMLAKSKQEGQVIIAAEKFEKVVSDCDGKSIPIKKWFEIFEKNAEAYELSEKQKYVQARSKMIGSAELFLESECVSGYTELKELLIEEFSGSYNSAVIHKKLQDRKKKREETLHDYLLQMKKIAALGEVETVALITHIVNGLDIKKEYKGAMLRCKTLKELKQEFEIYESLNIVDKPNIQPKPKQITQGVKADHCFNCGSREHKRKDCTLPTKCFSCNQEGHISSKCPEKVNSMRIHVDSARTKPVIINGIIINCLVDTGSDVTIIKEAIFKKMKDVDLNRTATVLRGLGNASTQPIGCFRALIKTDQVEASHNVLVVHDSKFSCDGIVGHDFISKFRLICSAEGYTFLDPEADKKQAVEYSQMFNICEESSFTVAPQYREDVERMIERTYETPPKQIKQCPVELKIIPDGVIKPFRHGHTRLSEEEAIAVKKQVEEWVEQSIVRKSTSNVASRIVVVKKKDGTLRVCVDYRKLNTMVLMDCFPVPIMEEVLEKLQSAKWFTTMDLQNGFFHVAVEEASKPYTAFVTREGLFEFNKAPFGFKNSPAAFIRFVQFIFQELINSNIMQLYMDDIIVYAATPEECMEKTEMVLKRAAEFGLKIKWKKCNFMQRRIHFLGHIIEGGQICPGKEKTSAVNSFGTPQNVKAVQGFLGLTGFFRKFIPGYAQIARPLTDLLKKDAIFNIGPVEQQSVNKLKEILVNEPVLRIYSREAETELHTDASKDGLGAVLLQKFEGSFHPVCFWSRKTTKAESNRHSYYLEVKAAYLALKKFRHYLLGVPFKLVTDCVAFKQTTKKADVPREVGPWILYMQDFNFQPEHRAGERMRHVDFLSRHPQACMMITSELTARIKKSQQNDDSIRAILEILKDRLFQPYKLKGGLLYSMVNGNELLVVPALMEREVIQSAHEVGHLSLQKTMHSIQQQFFIPHLEYKVKKLISNCIKCIIHSKKLGKQEGYLNCIDKGDAPLHTLHIDHLGPMDSSAKQYKYILATVDAFSKFVWLFPTKSTGQEEVVKRLTDWSNIFGFPKRIVSDKGTAFTSGAFEQFMSSHNVEHVCTTTGVARGNGQIERVNRLILAIISKLSSDEPSKWYKYVPEVQKAINCHVHSSLKLSPFEVMFGTKMYTRVEDRLLELLQEEVVCQFNEDRYEMRQLVKRNIEQAQKDYKRNYDKKRRAEYKYKAGDLVAIKRTQFVAGRKMASGYLGPYEVTGVKDNGRYDVKKAANVEGPNVTSTSCDNMKLWKYIAENADLLSSGSDDDDQEGRM